MTTFKTRTFRLQGATRSALLIAAVMCCALHSGASDPTSGPEIPPARPGLAAIPAPILDPLETTVREQLDSAAETFRLYVESDSATDAGLADAYGYLGQLYLAYDFTEASRLCLLNASQLAPTEFSWHHLLGYVYQQIGQLEDAVTYYRVALRLRPGSEATTTNLGNVYLQLNQLDEARFQFRKVLELAPNSAPAEAGLGQLALMERRYEEAIKLLASALSRVPDANRLHYLLAMAYRGAGMKDEAEKHLALQGSVGLRPVDELVDGLQKLRRGEKVYLLEGQRAFNAGRFSEAATAYSKSVEANPESVTGRINLGSALAMLGDTDGAIREFREALRIVPENATAQYNLAMLLKQQGSMEESINHFRAVLDTYPNDLGSQRELADTLLSMDRFDEAVPHLRSVLALDPTDVRARSILVFGLVESRRFEEAIAVLEWTHKALPQDPAIANELARVLATCPDVALRDGERALELATASNRANPVIVSGETAAFALAELGRCEEAAQLQARLLESAELDAENDLAVRLRSALELYQSGPPCRP